MANCKTTGVFQPSHCRGLLYDAIHGWMTGWMDGKIHEKWMTGRMDGKLHEKGRQRLLIYVISGARLYARPILGLVKCFWRIFFTW